MEPTTNQTPAPSPVVSDVPPQATAPVAPAPAAAIPPTTPPVPPTTNGEHPGMPYLVAFTLVLLALVLGALGMYFYEGKNITQHQPEIPLQNEQPIETVQTYSSPTLGVEFEYDSEYVVEERNATTSNTIVLMRSEDVKNIPEGGEGPPSITVTVLKNTKNQFPSVWAQENKIYSNINLVMGSTTEYVLGGANAIRYTADGLYVSDTIVVAHGENMYVFSGAYMDTNSEIRQDFIKLLATVKFIPQPGQE